MRPTSVATEAGGLTDSFGIHVDGGGHRPSLGETEQGEHGSLVTRFEKDMGERGHDSLDNGC